MSVIRVCFLGTPDFAATHLKAMLEDDHYQIVGVITQPDRPAGRSLKLTPSPVKVLALAHQLNVGLMHVRGDGRVAALQIVGHGRGARTLL